MLQMSIPCSGLAEFEAVRSASITEGTACTEFLQEIAVLIQYYRFIDSSNAIHRMELISGVAGRTVC